MFLRSLQIRGFKSFADKTVLEFAPGVSVIVGPNGSGKSNLVDAISWVLGEQGPRALRGGQMADVIFAGSPARPQLGMAEVKLVIDNSAGVIPVPMSEIEISRAIFRSGESEYRIGGQVVRLLDVQELLAESGIGRALHTIVSQGELDTILTARPEDRRQYVEEAAGVAKHRKRKERAERKLAGLDQDLLRLQDVLAELRRQLKPLKQQAEMAKRHEELTAQADEISVKLAAARLRGLLAERDRRTAGWDEGLEKRKAARARLDELDERVQAAADERARAVWALQESESSLREAQTAKSDAEVGIRRAVEEESTARQALAAEATRGVRLTALDEDLARIGSRLQEIAEELEGQERDLAVAEHVFREDQERRRQVEEERRRVSEEAAAHRAEMETLRRSIAGYERDRARLDEQLGDVRARRAAAEAERDGLSQEIERLDSKTAPLSEMRLANSRRRCDGTSTGGTSCSHACRTWRKRPARGSSRRIAADRSGSWESCSRPRMVGSGRSQRDLDRSRMRSCTAGGRTRSPTRPRATARSWPSREAVRHPSSSRASGPSCRSWPRIPLCAAWPAPF
jgi:chromosome segregation protein